MTMIKVSLSQLMELPEGAEIEVAETGATVGFRLADGRIVRPWISFEIEEHGGESYHDLSYDELVALDIDAEGLDFERDIEQV